MQESAIWWSRGYQDGFEGRFNRAMRARLDVPPDEKEPYIDGYKVGADLRRHIEARRRQADVVPERDGQDAEDQRSRLK